ncbi:unnamed protein product [Mytilus coruscus]|uniref:TRIM2_3 n=1 Tax=Mytilus coruscus TaxID=42192 RepID=A0A6J8AKC4_MYTCO|nr:unnamed protein product [Mytilus coruscus]
MRYNEDGYFIHTIPVSATPYDLTVIDTDHIAVSYNTLNYIEVIDIRKMIVLKTVKFKNNCWGISYSDGKIYVVVRYEGIVVLDIEGTILNTVKCSIDVSNITTIDKRVYYTRQNQGSVHCCRITGDEIWDFNDKTLGTPRGICAAQDQNVFVVGYQSNNLLMVQDDGKVRLTLLTKTDGLDRPSRVCYNKEKNMLLVCNQTNGVAVLFRVL